MKPAPTTTACVAFGSDTQDSFDVMDFGCSFEAANVALATPEPPFGGMCWKMVRSALLSVVDERNDK